MAALAEHKGPMCGAGCGKPAAMTCPTCKKLGVKPMAQFCSQPCFESFWPEHKGVHKAWKAKAEAAAAAEAADAKPPAWAASYGFTGTLRPAAYGPRRMVPTSIPWPDYAISSIPHSEREDKMTSSAPKVYSPAEIANIREACRIGRLALDAVGAAIKVGVTTDELDKVCHEVHVANGAYPSPLNYYKFPKSVCTSVNEVGLSGQSPLPPGPFSPCAAPCPETRHPQDSRSPTALCASTSTLHFCTRQARAVTSPPVTPARCPSRRQRRYRGHSHRCRYRHR